MHSMDNLKKLPTLSQIDGGKFNKFKRMTRPPWQTA